MAGSTIKFTKILLIVLSMSSIVTGCTSTQVDEISADKYFANVTDREFSRDKHAPKLGLALAGGGTKAASFAMGVMAGLNDAGLLDDVDVISSVSGGGYASYFYFSKLMKSNGNSNSIQVSSIFNSCMSQLGQDYFGGDDSCYAGSRGMPIVSSKMLDKKYPIDAGVFYQKICPQSSVDVFYDCQIIDDYKFQSHLMGRLDFLNNDEDYSNRNSNNNDSSYFNTAVLIGETILTWPLHWFANGVFDWRLNISPSQIQYQNGIMRGYGYTPLDFNDAKLNDGWSEINKTSKGDSGGGRGINWSDFDMEIKAQSFSNLEKLYASNEKVPLWVINTTNVSSNVLGFSKNNMLNDIFEVTPFAYGSVKHGYINATIEGKNIPDLVLASAAFLDYQQDLKPIANPFMRAANVYWGININNPERADWERALHDFLPFPLYMLQPGWSRSGEEPLYFHLSDGGQADNLGIVSLIRRKTENIIVADESYDRNASMEDFCKVANSGIQGDPAFGVDDHGIPLYRWVIALPEEGSLYGECDNFIDGKKYNASNSVYRWKKPVVHGVVFIIKNDGSNKKYSDFSRYVSDNSKDGFCPSVNEVGTQCLNVFWLKPAYDISLADLAVKKCPEKMFNRKGCLAQYILSDEYAIKYPPSILAFYLNNSGLIQENDPDSYFPQDSTVFNTLNSSPPIYSAYRDLGRFYSYLAAMLYEKNFEAYSKFVIESPYKPLKGSRMDKD